MRRLDKNASRLHRVRQGYKYFWWPAAGGRRAMLQKLGTYISEAWQNAADAEHRASSADSSELRVEYERLAKSWRRLARSFEFAQTLERFILDRDNAGEAPPEPPSGD
jgi:putative heme degradation protein